MNTPLSDIVGFIDTLLNIKNVPDWANALNGLQLANMGHVGKIGAAVDAGEPTLRKAEAAGVDLLLVHHGLFWAGLQPLTGPAYRKVAMAIRADMAVYSAHLPLDLHPALGNNALLARAIGLTETEPFFFERGNFLGLKGAMRMPLDELVARVEKAVAGPVKVIRGGPREVGVAGVVTGGAGQGIHHAGAEGVDTFITGEGPHWSAIVAEELGVNLLLAGHYATETFGVKALAAHVGEKFGLPWEFIDHPTGL
ncbi:MAG: Nif3-like dinuclear metal center hexameric protein [Chthoniobacteraceae bacterium]|jgi:dinuclear metal center YbgI/SA1388 family protein